MLPSASRRGFSADERLPTLVPQLVQLRPTLADPAREVWLVLASGQLEVVRLQLTEPDPQHQVLFDDEVKVHGSITAHVTVRRAGRPLPPGSSRATRRGGLAVSPAAPRTSPLTPASRAIPHWSERARCRRSSAVAVFGRRRRADYRCVGVAPVIIAHD